MDTQLIFDFARIRDCDALKLCIEKVCGDYQSAIPLIVRLIENPQSPIALPGKIDLYNHDCLHLLLNRGQSLFDEAFIIGFTMGNDDKTSRFHVKVFKFFSEFLYPQKYQFKLEHFQVFDLGFYYGKKLSFRNINQVDFRDKKYQEKTITQLRAIFNINLNDIRKLEQIERELLTQDWSVTTKKAIYPQFS